MLVKELLKWLPFNLECHKKILALPNEKVKLHFKPLFWTVKLLRFFLTKKSPHSTRTVIIKATGQKDLTFQRTDNTLVMNQGTDRKKSKLWVDVRVCTKPSLYYYWKHLYSIDHTTHRFNISVRTTDSRKTRQNKISAHAFSSS